LAAATLNHTIKGYEMSETKARSQFKELYGSLPESEIYDLAKKYKISYKAPKKFLLMKFWPMTI
jgi:hypothetical protein